MTKITQIFICYAHKDNNSQDPSKQWLNRLREQLAPLELEEQAEIWSDQSIESGETWHERIQEALQKVKTAVLLVSPAFLESKYIRNSELPVLLKNAKEKGVVILPIILRPCLWKETRFKYPDSKIGPEALSLSDIQVPTTAPLNSLSEHEQDQVLYKIAQRISHLVRDPQNPDDSSSQKKEKLKSEKGVDYTHLQKLLAAKAWKEADQETIIAMLKATDKKDSVSSKDIKNLPCEDLEIIDRLWRNHSHERFGFSIQQRIYYEAGKDYDSFCVRVGWKVNGRWIGYNDLNWTSNAPEGHLPSIQGRLLYPTEGQKTDFHLNPWALDLGDRFFGMAESIGLMDSPLICRIAKRLEDCQ
jgi:hypothetical protein